MIPPKSRSCTAVNNVPPAVQADPISQTLQYSNYISNVTITGTDIISDPLTIFTIWRVNGGVTITPGLPLSLMLAKAVCSPGGSNTQACNWALSSIANVSQGSYNITAAVADDDNGRTPITTTLVLKPEDARVTFDSGNPVAVKVATPGGNSGAFQLKVHVQEVAESGPPGAPGDINSAQVSVALEPVGPGSAVTVPCTSPGSVPAHRHAAVLAQRQAEQRIALHPVDLVGVRQVADEQL